MAFLVYPANPNWGVLTVDAEEFELDTDGITFTSGKEAFVAYFPVGQFIGFVYKP